MVALVRASGRGSISARRGDVVSDDGWAESRSTNGVEDRDRSKRLPVQLSRDRMCAGRGDGGKCRCRLRAVSRGVESESKRRLRAVSQGDPDRSESRCRLRDVRVRGRWGRS